MAARREAPAQCIANEVMRLRRTHNRIATIVTRSSRGRLIILPAHISSNVAGGEELRALALGNDLPIG